MTEKNGFVAYRGPAEIHDSTLVAVERCGTELKLLLLAYDGKEFNVPFVGVESVSNQMSIGSLIFALSEMEHTSAGRRFVLVNSDEQAGSLEVIAAGLAVESNEAG